MSQPLAVIVCRLRIGANGFVLTIACLIAVAGCASEEKLQKSKGYYQEGLANMQGDRQQAFVSLQKAIQLNPNHKEAHYLLGHLYALQVKYPEAEQELRAALRIDSEYSDAY